MDEFHAEDVRAVDDQSLEDGFGDLNRAAEAIEAERLRWLAEIRRRRTYERDGFVSATSWLVDRHGLAGGVASRALRMAKFLDRAPDTAEALASGEISLSAAEALRAAWETNAAEYHRTEATLLDAASTLSVRDLSRVIGYWRQAVDERDPDRRFDRRGLHVSPSVFGMVRVDGDLDPECGQALLTAIRAVVDAEVRSGDDSDVRSPAQRRADALGEICRYWLAFADRPVVGGERPHVSVLVDLEALEGGPGRSELEDAGPITPEAARRIACDASVSRIVTRGPSEPLDVGRKTPVVSPALRRALVVRDKGCRFPGCDRPPGWCDAHHVKHWADGGETSLANTLLLCRRHHGLVHPPNGFRLNFEDERTVFRRPDGSVLEERAPP